MIGMVVSYGDGWHVQYVVDTRAGDGGNGDQRNNRSVVFVWIVSGGRGLFFCYAENNKIPPSDGY